MEGNINNGNVNNGNVIGVLGGSGGGGADPALNQRVSALETWQKNPNENNKWVSAYIAAVTELYGESSILCTPFDLLEETQYVDYINALEQFMTDTGRSQGVWVAFDYNHMAVVSKEDVTYAPPSEDYDKVVGYGFFVPESGICKTLEVGFLEDTVVYVDKGDDATFLSLYIELFSHLPYEIVTLVGDKNMLTTQTKSNIVAAINEVNSNATGGASTDITIDNGDSPSLPLLCGQPMILFGAGTPQEAIVPDNWKQFDPETEEGYNWTGVPSALGQIYVNRSVSTNSRYIAVRGGNYSLKWIQ